jgi:hypothetical protein
VELCVRTSGWSGRPVLLGNRDTRDPKNPGFAITASDELRWKLSVGDGSRSGSASGPVVADGLWHHLAAVFRTGGSVRLFQDGIPTGLLDVPGLTGCDSPHGLSLGRRAGPGAETEPHLPVEVTEILIWDAALSDSAVAARAFLEPEPGQDPPAAYWKLDGAGSPAVPDAGPLALHGAAIGGTPDWTQPDDAARILGFQSCRTVKAVDAAVTALAHFGLPARPEWNLDGRDWHSPDTASAVPPSAVRDAGSPHAPPSAFPNPFNETTTLSFFAPEPGPFRLAVHDLAGRETAVVAEGSRPESGPVVRRFRAGGLPSGVYVARLRTASTASSVKVLLVR